VEEVRFELTDPCGSTVFKTAALNQAQPLFRWYGGGDDIINGVEGGIRTHGFTVLQTVPLDLSGTSTLFGSGRGNRTPINGFGDRCNAIIPDRNI
jgi:hypothetical protein